MFRPNGFPCNFFIKKLFELQIFILNIVRLIGTKFFFVGSNYWFTINEGKKPLTWLNFLMDIFIYLPFRAEIRCFPFKLKKRNSTRKTVQVGPVVVVKKEKNRERKKPQESIVCSLLLGSRSISRMCLICVVRFWRYYCCYFAPFPNVVYSRSALNLISYASKTT